MKWLVLILMRFYQHVLAVLVPANSCRFFPSCSTYMIEAVERYGAIKGVYLGIKRLLRCHPWHEGGYDPVP